MDAFADENVAKIDWNMLADNFSKEHFHEQAFHLLKLSPNFAAFAQTADEHAPMSLSVGSSEQKHVEWESR